MRAWLLAFLASALVWVIPLVGPHAVFAVGPMLWRMAAREGAHAPFWLGLATVVVAHVALTVLLWRLRRQAPGVKGGALFVGLVALTVAFHLAFFVGIPTLTLLERDPRPEVGDLPDACAVEGFDLPFPPSPALARTGRVLVRPVSEAASLAWLSVPGCALAPTPIPSNVAVLSSEDGGKTLYALLHPKDSRYEWFLASTDAGARPVGLAWRQGLGPPVLLKGGDHVAWLEPRLTEAGFQAPEPPFAFLVVQSLGGDELRRAPLPGLERGSWRLFDGSGPEGPFHVLREAPREFRAVGADGTLLGERPRQPGPEFERQLSTVVLYPGGWLGWDVYAEERRYVVAWDLPAGRGRIEEPKGRGVTSAAADPAGRYVAYSTTTTLNVGSVPDAIALLRASDGTDVWRRRLPRYARAQVALFAEHLAWSDSTSVPPRVRVLRLPAE